MTHLNPLLMAQSSVVGEENSNQNTRQHHRRRKDALEKFIENPSNNNIISSSLSQLRHSILVNGMPENCPYRIYIWSILLRSPPVETEWYSGQVVKQAMPLVKTKIKNDCFRTFAQDKHFQQKVSEDQLVRLLNVFAWTVSEEEIISHYVQGMNILAGVTLYVSRSEPEAFGIFQTLIRENIPRYCCSNLRGVQDGVKLVDLILHSVDKKLFTHLSKCMLSAKIYALPLVLTLSASVPPLDEVVKLWDFLFSYGCHMNIVFIVSQIILMRDEILKSKSPMSLLRQFPTIQSDKIIKLSLSITKNMNAKLYDLLVRHTHDESVSDIINTLSSIESS